jgi:nitrogen fixation/metabolism regulation signal transduction histidine kinase
MAPLGAAAYLISGLDKVAADLGSDEAKGHVEALDQSMTVYGKLVETTKRLLVEIADRLAKRPDLLALDPKANLQQIMEDEAGLRGIAIVRDEDTIIAQASRPSPGSFAVPDIQQELDRLKARRDAAFVIANTRTALPEGYRISFLALMGIAALAAAIVGVLMSTRVTRRIASLVTTARRVSDGRHDARVALTGGDEMAELGSAFNTMLDDLAQTRSQLSYLQRIGAWQDVARRLAHEIKNPLTPIQLAVQQCVSAYKGDDTRFAQLLKDTGEIVEEEINGLRRLVDTFRTLGQLPKVEKVPLALGDVIEELKLDPQISARLELKPPERPVTVRADKLLLKRVLANLVENGIHAGQEAGHEPNVVISWSAGPDAVNINVDDRGKGVAEADRERIFEPYVTTKSTGTGLGLAIARKIAIEHGGELAVAPKRAPTGGARFVVSLPLRGPETSLV